MKAKEAVKIFEGKPTIKAYDLYKLYFDELSNRISLRTHNRPLVSQGVFVDLVKEMDGWFVKVCRGLSLTDDATEKMRSDNKAMALSSMRRSVEHYNAERRKGHE